MSCGIFFCKSPNSICLLAGTKTIREPRERERLFGLSGEGPKTEQEEGDGGEEGGGETVG